MAPAHISWAKFALTVECDNYPQNLEELPALFDKAEVFLQKCIQRFSDIQFQIEQIMAEARESSQAFIKTADYLVQTISA